MKATSRCLRAMQAYRDIGFTGPFSLDHAPIWNASPIPPSWWVTPGR